MGFSVHVDPDDFAKQDLAAGLSPDPVAIPGHRAAEGLDAGHHGARDTRQAARDRSERDRSGRAAGASGGRTYAFRRS